MFRTSILKDCFAETTARYSKTTSEATYKYDNAITFAYRFGAGVTFDRISIGLHWYNLGSAKVKGKIEIEENYNDSDGETEHDSDKENFKWKDLSIIDDDVDGRLPLLIE